jgi:hypothetical protein
MLRLPNLPHPGPPPKEKLPQAASQLILPEILPRIGIAIAAALDKMSIA